MLVGNRQCNAANLNQNEAQFQLELSLAQFSPSLFPVFSFEGFPNYQSNIVTS